MVARGVPKSEAKMLAQSEIRDTESLLYAKEFIAGLGADDPPLILVMAGTKGVGKTIAACYALRYITPQPLFGGKWAADELPRFRHSSDLVEILFGADDERKMRSELKRCSVLAIDDIGAELKSDQFLAYFDALVNHRYGLGAGITIITTNLSIDLFTRRYGERVMDRVRGRGVWYDIQGESLRGRPS